MFRNMLFENQIITFIQEPGDCFGDGQPYIGRVQYTNRGRPCIRWEYLIEVFSFLNLSEFPDYTWDELGNNCRLILNLNICNLLR